MTTSERIFLCPLDDLEDPGSRGFSLSVDDQQLEGFLVRYDGQVHAYRNSCPHTGSPLDWVEHQFLDADLAFIQCAVHDARFQIESGECIAGPCVGDHLQPLAIEVDGDAVFLSEVPTSPPPGAAAAAEDDQS